MFSPLCCADRWFLSWPAALLPSPSFLGYFDVFLAFLESSAVLRDVRDAGWTSLQAPGWSRSWPCSALR